MLSTAGLVPVAQEFCTAGRKGSCGSEFSPVSPECPSAMMPRSAAGAEAVALNGLVDAVPAPLAVAAVMAIRIVRCIGFSFRWSRLSACGLGGEPDRARKVDGAFEAGGGHRSAQVSGRFGEHSC